MKIIKRSIIKMSICCILFLFGCAVNYNPQTVSMPRTFPDGVVLKTGNPGYNGCPVLVFPDGSHIVFGRQYDMTLVRIVDGSPYMKGFAEISGVNMIRSSTSNGVKMDQWFCSGKTETEAFQYYYKLSQKYF